MAGLGKRLRPHTLTVPKPLLPIAGKPIVHRLVEDIAKVTPEKIDYIGFIIHPSFGKEVEESLKAIAKKVGAEGKIYYQEEAFGISHALLFAKELFTGKVIVAFADTLFKAEFKLEVQVEEEVPPNFLRSVTRGEEGTRASMLSARTLLELQEPEPGVTEVRYSTEISVVGRLGKFGLGVMKKKAQGLGGDFVKTLRERLEPAT